MAQVSATVRAVHFRSDHVVGAIFARRDGTGQRLEEARPTAAAFVLRGRVEERLSASGASKCALALLLVQGAGAGPFGRVLTHHAILFRSEFGCPLRIAFLYGEDLFLHMVSLTF